MPLYEFRCEAGHVTEEVCKMDLSDAPTRCPVIRQGCFKAVTEEGTEIWGLNPECRKPLTKIISAPTNTFPGADSWRK